MGRGSVGVRVVPDADPLGGEHFYVEVPMRGFEPWTRESRVMYGARLELRQGVEVLDVVEFRFGWSGWGGWCLRRRVRIG